MGASQSKRRWAGKVGWTLFALFLLFLAALSFIALATLPAIALAIEFAGLLLFGWISYLRGVLPRVSFNAEIAANAGIALILATAGLHRILVWWARKQTAEGAPWRYASTLKTALMVLLLFATSIAATGIVHQVGWLFRAKELTYDASRGLMTRELSNIKQVATALRLYANDFDGKLPRDLEKLVPDYLPDRRLFFTSIERGEPPERILYFPDHQGADPDQTIVLAGPHPSPSGRRTVALRDASAQVVKEKEFQEMLRPQTPASANSAPPP